MFLNKIIIVNLALHKRGTVFEQLYFKIDLMKKIIFILICSITLGAFAQKDAQAEKILNAMSKKYQSMKSFKANFSVVFYSPINKKDEKSSGNILVKGSKYVLKMSEREIYNNGVFQWTYTISDNEATKTKYVAEEDELNPTKIYTMYKKGFKYIVNKEKGVNENPALYDVVDLIPENKDKQVFKVRIVINKKDNTIHGWKTFEKNGNRYTFLLTNFQQNVPADDKVFDFDKKGVDIVDLD